MAETSCICKGAFHVLVGPGGDETRPTPGITSPTMTRDIVSTNLQFCSADVAPAIYVTCISSKCHLSRHVMAIVFDFLLSCLAKS